MKRFLLVLVLALFLALAAAQPALALGFQGISEFEFPQVFVAALLGVVGSLILQALKDKMPEVLVGRIALLGSAIVVGVLNILSGVITLNVDPGLWPLITQTLLYLTSLLTSWATFKLLFKKPKPAILPA